jgi:hypothetical protein
MRAAAPTQRDPHLQCIVDHGCMGWQKASGYTNMPVSGTIHIQLCVADRPFDRRLKTKFGSDVGKFLRVHVAPVQGEKAESREASCAEIGLFCPSFHIGFTQDHGFIHLERRILTSARD